uniref:Transmembrane protein n=1 Tax=Panagrolaimus sp. PS1159 TaxID=55785 RepID=A0AC35GNY7_9BILA
MTLTERTNYTKINSLYLDLFLDSANNNILEAVNRNSLDAANLEFSVESFTAPSIDLNITLTLDNPIYILNTKVANFIVVTSAENLQFKLQDSPLIIIYSNAQYGTQVYNNQSLTNNICFLNSSPFICKVHSNKLALLQLYNDELFYLPFLAIQLWGHSKGCVFKENVLILSGVETIFLSKLANDEECAVYVLIENDSHFYISSLWATSNEETIKIFIGDKQNILLLEYNSFSAKLWQTILLFSPVYKILIPSRASVAITFVGYKDTEGFVLYPSYKSIFASPYYGSTKNNLGAIQSFDYIIGNFTAKFTALSYKTNANINSLYFSTERGKQEQVKKVGDYLLFKNVTVTVIYDASLQPENEAIFLIET